MPTFRDQLFSIWGNLYPETSDKILDNFLSSIEFYHSPTAKNISVSDWYKDAVVYSLYVDLFNNDFNGLAEKLDYLQQLGVNCLWLLPILDSPMRDGGFDIQDYYSIRPELAGDTHKDRNEIFKNFIEKAHKHGIKVIFDVAVNHLSEEHPWFVEARKSKDNPYRQFFIWNKDDTLYNDARIIFKGIETSNWEKYGDEYFFHRFFNFQPDLNYKNPEVLLAMSRVLLYWQNTGIDGFRADAIPYIWKKEGTACENLPETHLVVKFFRALLDYVKPGTLLLAEACQQPAKVVEYMGNGDECHAAYHFPLMPRIYKSIAMQSGSPIEDILSEKTTPKLPENGQWFTFLRCHDELSLERVYVTEEERKYIHENYCHQPLWDFRMGEGIAARLSELMQRDARKVLLAYSLILTLPGTPVIYYGDEVGAFNDEENYRQMIELVGKDDTRFLVRGKMNWQQVKKDLTHPESFGYDVYKGLTQMLAIRNKHKAFGRGSIQFIETHNKKLLAFKREYQNEHWLILNNMSSENIACTLPELSGNKNDIFGKHIANIEPYGFRWVKM